jgi:RNA polymerase sigma-70 factor (ECF subfamily)
MTSSVAVFEEEPARLIEHLYVFSLQARAVAHRILWNRADVEEAVQDAYLEAWRWRERFDPRRGSLGAWFLSIVRSRALDRLRQEGARSRREHEAASDVVTEAVDGSEQPRCDNERLLECLRQLTAGEQEVLRYAYFFDCSQLEIMHLTGIPLGTVKSRATRGLKRLARLFDATLRESATASLPRGGATSEDSSLHDGICYAVHDGPVQPRSLGPGWGKAAGT